MKYRMYFAAAAALCVAVSPAMAQSHDSRAHQDHATIRHDERSDHDRMSRHDMSEHRGMSMHRHMSRSHMMRWCRSLSHHQMMMNRECRAMMHTHHSARMHRM